MKKQTPHLVTIAIVAAVICLLLYMRALSCDFVNWDDPDYVLNNELIRAIDWKFLRTIFTTVPNDFYIPLTTLSLAIDYHFWGMNPFGYHLTNIILHAANAGMLVLLADRILRNRYPMSLDSSVDRGLYPLTLLLAGLLFAVHPLRVESVAWVTERKDVLNGLFTLCSMFFYLHFVEERDGGGRRGLVCKAYLICFIFFLMSLMSKPSSIVLPFILLVLDWYPLKRLREGRIVAVLIEKLPFLLVSLLIIPATTVRFAELDTFHSVGFFPIPIRVIVSGNALFEYFKLLFLPVGILPYYDLPLAIPKVYIVKAVAVAIFLICVLYWGRRRPWLTAATACYILPLVPVLPFLGNGASIALAARYTYLPAIVPSILAAVLIGTWYGKMSLAGQKNGKVAICAVTLVLLFFYAALTEKMIGVWKNSATMWTRVIDYQPFDRAYFYRGLHYTDEGNYVAAVQDYTACLAIDAARQLPELYNLYAFRGEALTLAGRYREAVDDFDKAIGMFPHHQYFYYRSLALKGLGRDVEAEGDAVKAGGGYGKMRWFPQGAATDER